MTVVTLLSRPGCHLCDEARESILGLRAEGHEFELEEIDIDSDDDLFRANLEKIPVVSVDGRLVSELILDLPDLRARVATVPTQP